MARGKNYRDLSPASKRKLDSKIRRYYGDSKSDRDRALRDRREGKWTPNARSTVRQVPQRLSRQALNYPEFLPAGVGNDLRDAALRNMDNQLGDRVNKYGEIAVYNRFTVIDGIGEANTDALIRLASATESQLIDAAAWQADKQRPDRPEKGTPKWVRDMGWTDSDGRWHNLAWYH